MSFEKSLGVRILAASSRLVEEFIDGVGVLVGEEEAGVKICVMGLIGEILLSDLAFHPKGGRLKF